MRIGLRSRLFWLPVITIAVVMAAAGVYLRTSLHGELQQRTKDELLRHARSTRELLTRMASVPTGAGLDAARVQPLARRMGRATSSRITIIDARGAVLGDSELTLGEVRRLESHRMRPEVHRALTSGHGVARRYSNTLKQDMLYVALATQAPGRMVLRAATPLSAVQQTMRRVDLLLVVSGLLALGLVIVTSGFASRAFGQTLRRLVASVRRVSAGEDPPSQLAHSRADELGGLLGPIHGMARELEQMVRHLATERDRFQALLEGLGEGVLALDPEGRVTHANGAAMRLLGLAATPEGRPLHEAVRVPALHDLVDGSPPQSTRSAELELPTNPPRKLLASVAPQGAAGGRLLVLHDLTELRRLETVRKDFVANVSHELRTPVSVILANTETLLDGAMEDREQAGVFLQALRRNAERLSSLIADLLVLSRIDAGKYPLELHAVDLAAVARTAVAATALSAEQKQQQLQLDAEPHDAAHRVLADERAVSQVVHNLLDNAVKYTPAGGRIAVRLRARAGQVRPEQVRLEVQDNGPGIEPRHRQRIFERFYRVDTGRSRQMGGTGLGLAIVKNLVESMGGQIGVEGAEPQGSLFWVDLPAAGEESAVRTPTPAHIPTATRREVSAPDAAPPRTPAGLSAGSPRAAEVPAGAASSHAPEPAAGGGALPAPQLTEVRKRLLLMAGQVEEMIALSVRSLVEQDAALARRTIRIDRRVNRDEIEIDAMCVELLTRRQLQGNDLRFVTLALKMVIDLERVGDLAVNICERAVDLADKPLLRPFTEIAQMDELVRTMLHDAVDAFVDRDPDKAQSVIDRDDLVDQLYGKAFRAILEVMVRSSGGVERGIHTQSVAKWLERMADHMTNLAEQVILMLQGTDLRHQGKLDVR